jgi:hypothetical protein
MSADLPVGLHGEFPAMAQGRTDYTLPAFPTTNNEFGTMLTIAATEEAVYVTKAQAMAFFGLKWQPISTAPKDGTEFLAWFQKVKLDDDDNMTDEVIGGAMAMTSFTGGSWNEPEWLDAHGSYFFEDWCFAESPVLWHALPAGPDAACCAAIAKASA